MLWDFCCPRLDLRVTAYTKDKSGCVWFYFTAVSRRHAHFSGNCAFLSAPFLCNFFSAKIFSVFLQLNSILFFILEVFLIGKCGSSAGNHAQLSYR